MISAVLLLNNPLNMVAHKIITTIATNNCFMCKPTDLKRVLKSDGWIFYTKPAYRFRFSKLKPKGQKILAIK